jgi:hypothetical protein
METLFLSFLNAKIYTNRTLFYLALLEGVKRHLKLISISSIVLHFLIY